MKLVVFALLLLTPLAARAASPAETYLAARDGYLAKFKKAESGTIDDSVMKQHDLAIGDLENQLTGIIGPFEMKGIPSNGKINLDTLFASDEGFGLLDGLAFSSDDGKTHAVVTTNTLLDHWLKEHENWWREYANPPQEIGDALKSDVLYTQAIATEGSFATYAEIPLEKPATAQRAAALLVAGSPYIDEEWPDELIVSVEAQDRTFIVDAPVEAKIPAAPACDKIWRDSERQADDAYSAYSASDPKNQELLDRYTEIREEGDAAFHKCFAANALTKALLAALARQAQAIADSLPAK